MAILQKNRIHAQFPDGSRWHVLLKRKQELSHEQMFLVDGPLVKGAVRSGNDLLLLKSRTRQPALVLMLPGHPGVGWQEVLRAIHLLNA